MQPRFMKRGQGPGSSSQHPSCRPRLTLEPVLAEALKQRAQDHGGVPVGALLVPTQHVSACFQLFKGWNLHILGVENHELLSPAFRLLHLPPQAVIAFESPDGSEMSTSLTDFARSSNSAFFAGVRRQDVLFGRAPEFAPEMRNARFTFAEIFAGIGGFRLGLEPLGGRCVMASEIDRHAQNTYRTNWPEANKAGLRLVGDITAVYASNIPKIDVLTAGFPCQPFSVRGHMEGLEDQRGQLYKELVRLLLACKPPSFIFENVVGLVTMKGGSRSRSKASNGGLKVSHDHGSIEATNSTAVKFEPGEVFTRILDELGSCGYKVSWKVVNAREWLPQCRERVYIVGFRSDLGITMPWDLVNGNAHGSVVSDVLLPWNNDEVLACKLTEPQWEKLQAQTASYPRWHGMPCPMSERTLKRDGKAPTLNSSYHSVTGYSTKFVFEADDEGLAVETDASTRKRPRFLSPRECSRLMGFPDSFKIPHISDKHAIGPFYRQIGNAVCPPVIQAIGRQLLLLLEGTEKFGT